MSRERVPDNSGQISEDALAIPEQPMPTRRNFRNIKDQEFFNLTAVAYVGPKGRIAAWRCRCKCGNFCIVTSNVLLEGGKKQCVRCAREGISDRIFAMHETKRADRLPNLYKGADSKACCECKIVKSVNEFTCRRKEPDGLARQCKECLRLRRWEWTEKNGQKIRDDNRTASQKYAAAHPERIREARLKCKYGIGFAEYNQMLDSQNGGCAVCGAPPFLRPHSIHPTLCIDHDHATGLVRGLLCRQCNQAIGLLADSPDRAEKVAEYLRVAMSATI